VKRILKNQKVKYLMVGSLNTVIDFSLLFTFKYLGIPVLGSNIGSTTVAFLFSFFANKKFTFKSSGSTKRQFVLFTIVTLSGLWILQSVIIQAIINLVSSGEPTDLELLMAKIVATIASLIWNYLFYSRVVFKDKDSL